MAYLNTYSCNVLHAIPYISSRTVKVRSLAIWFYYNLPVYGAGPFFYSYKNSYNRPPPNSDFWAPFDLYSTSVWTSRAYSYQDFVIFAGDFYFCQNPNGTMEVPGQGDDWVLYTYTVLNNITSVFNSELSFVTPIIVSPAVPGYICTGSPTPGAPPPGPGWTAWDGSSATVWVPGNSYSPYDVVIFDPTQNRDGQIIAYYFCNTSTSEVIFNNNNEFTAIGDQYFWDDTIAYTFDSVYNFVALWKPTVSGKCRLAIYSSESFSSPYPKRLIYQTPELLMPAASSISQSMDLSGWLRPLDPVGSPLDIDIELQGGRLYWLCFVGDSFTSCVALVSDLSLPPIFGFDPTQYKQYSGIRVDWSYQSFPDPFPFQNEGLQSGAFVSPMIQLK